MLKTLFRIITKYTKFQNISLLVNDSNAIEIVYKLQNIKNQ